MASILLTSISASNKIGGQYALLVEDIMEIN